MNTQTQNLIAAQVNLLLVMITLEFPEDEINREIKHLARLWNITGEVGSA